MLKASPPIPQRAMPKGEPETATTRTRLKAPNVRRRAEGVLKARRGEGNEAVGVFKRVPTVLR